MKKLLCISAALILALGAYAQRPKPEYDLYYEYYFENREFDYKVDAPVYSGTINALALTPSVGLGFMQGDTTAHHRLSLGVDIRRDMGGSRKRYIDELSLYYDGHLRLKNGALFEGIIGVFPRHFCEGEYSRAFFSDSLRFADRNLEGTLIKYKTRNFYGELGADWMGRRETFIKERFMIFSAGNYSLQDWITLGWAGTFYHYAGSEMAPGVVDNHLLNPYVKINLFEKGPRRYLKLKFGLMGSYQRDREREAKANIKLGYEAVLSAKFKSLSFENSIFTGSGFQYLYNGKDLGGNKYGNNLYFGSPFYAYRVYDMIEAAWTPRLGKSLSLSIKSSFHFCQDGYIGNSQMLVFIVNLESRRSSRWLKGKIGDIEL